MIAVLCLVSLIGAQVPVEKPSQASKPAATSQKPAAQKPVPAKPVPAGPTIAITNARILTAAGPAIEKGTVVIRAGKIAAVGTTVAVPSGARVIDASGKIVTPGFIESNTNLGIVEIPLSAEGTADQSSTDPGVSAAFNVMDAFNPRSTAIPVTRVDGITRSLVVPGGTGHVVQGQAAVFDL